MAQEHPVAGRSLGQYRSRGDESWRTMSSTFQKTASSSSTITECDSDWYYQSSGLGLSTRLQSLQMIPSMDSDRSAIYASGRTELYAVPTRMAISITDANLTIDIPSSPAMSPSLVHPSLLVTVDQLLPNELVYDVPRNNKKWSPSGYGSSPYADPSSYRSHPRAESPLYAQPHDNRRRVARSESLLCVPLGLTRSRTALFELMAKTLRESNNTFRSPANNDNDAKKEEPCVSLSSSFTVSISPQSSCRLNEPTPESAFQAIVVDTLDQLTSDEAFHSSDTSEDQRSIEQANESIPVSDHVTTALSNLQWNYNPVPGKKSNLFNQHCLSFNDGSRPNIVFRQPMVYRSLGESTHLKFTSGRLSWLRYLKETFNAITRSRNRRPASGILFTDELLSCTDMDMFCRYTPPEWKPSDSNSLADIEESLAALETKARCHTACNANTHNSNLNTIPSRKTDTSTGCSCAFSTWGYSTQSSSCCTWSLDSWNDEEIVSKDLSRTAVSSTSNEMPAESLNMVSGSETSHLNDPGSPTQPNDGKHSLLQFALYHFRQSPEKFDMLRNNEDGTLRSVTDSSGKAKKNKGKKSKERETEWTWKEQVDLVKFTKSPIQASLLRLETSDLNKLALEGFLAIMKYMGDYPMAKGQSEVDSVYTILMNCHKHESLRDETFCQIMKQTTNNKSSRPDSCQRGWRLFSIIAAYFSCTPVLKPYLFKYLETAAYDKRRAYHGTAMVCLQNLRKTLRYGGRKNVPSIEEITAITAGRNSKRQMYRLPGGTERVINTKSTSVVQDIIEEICLVINVRSDHEMEEYSLYCIVEGDTFTMPLAREEYILDVTTELQKNQQVYYLIFCRSVWHYPMRLENPLYIEIVFNQIAPDYLEGLLLVMPGEQISQDCVYDIAKVAALLHRAADLDHMPTMKETKYLLPKPALSVRDIKPPQWVNLVQSSWKEVEYLKPSQAKAQVLEVLEKWPLFGSSFFAIRREADPSERSEHILALNKNGVHFLDVMTHETLLHYPFAEVISTRKVKSEDGILFLDMKCGNLMQQRVTRIQTDQAHEISRLIRQYITIQQRGQNKEEKHVSSR